VKDDKIQTGLRIPSSRYEQLKEMADRSGVSINSIALYLIDVGLRAVNLGTEELARSLSHDQQCNVAQCIPPDY